MGDSTVKVRVAERWFLKLWWWVFPVVAVLLAMLTGGGFWAWVEGEHPWLDWHQMFMLRTAALAVAGLAVVGAWRLFLNRKWPVWAVWALAAAGFVCVELAVRTPVAQTAFWLAVRARQAVDGPNFMSEVCFIRLEEAAGRSADAGAVILSGTSQMLVGVDERELRRMLAPVPVIRREVSGMVPQNMLAAWSWIPFRRGDRSVQVRSEMDFTNQGEWRTSWYRPFLTWETLPWLARNAGRAVWVHHWKEIPDCVLAASLEGWRMRDGWRGISMNPWRWAEGTGRSAPAAADVVAASAPLEWDEWEWTAFVAEAERLKAVGVELWVFEGDVNPVLHDARRAMMRQAFERRMTEGARDGLWRFVGEEELNAGIGASDWVDMTHLNEAGRDKLTKAMGRVLGKQ